MHGCLGSQWENTKDLFYPVKSVCDLNKVKVLFMHAKAEHFAKTHNLNTKSASDYINSIVRNLKEKEPEETEKWQTMIAKILI